MRGIEEANGSVSVRPVAEGAADRLRYIVAEVVWFDAEFEGEFEGNVFRRAYLKVVPRELVACEKGTYAQCQLWRQLSPAARQRDQIVGILRINAYKHAVPASRPTERRHCA